MKLVLHIVRKDFLRLRWSLAVWVLVIAANPGIGCSLLFGGGFAGLAERELLILTLGLLAADLGLTIALTATLVQEDPLVGSTQFWVTRPISSGRLLAAKVAGWLLLLWLPSVALMLPWWIVCGFDSGQIAHAVGESFALHVMVALPAALVASLTDTLSRFLVWAFVFMFGAAVIPGMLTYWSADRMMGKPFPYQTAAGWIAFGLAIAVVTVGQFRQRNAARSLVRLGVGALLAPVVAVVAGIVFGPTHDSGHRWTESHPERAGGVTLSLHSFDTGGPKKNGEEVSFNTTFAVQGLPRGLTLDTRNAVSARQTWRWPGGPEVTRSSSWLSAWDHQSALRTALGLGETPRDAETELYYKQQREKHRTTMTAAAVSWDQKNERREAVPIGIAAETTVLPSTVERMRQTPPAYEAKVQLRVIRPERWIEVPLKDGGWHAREGFGFRVGDRAKETPASDQVTLPLVVTRPEFLSEIVRGREWWGEFARGPKLVVISRAGGDLRSGGTEFATTVTIGSVEINCGQLTVWPPMLLRGERWVPRDARWLEGASMVLYGWREEARITRELRMERFENPKRD